MLNFFGVKGVRGVKGVKAKCHVMLLAEYRLLTPERSDNSF